MTQNKPPEWAEVPSLVDAASTGVESDRKSPRDRLWVVLEILLALDLAAKLGRKKDTLARDDLDEIVRRVIVRVQADDFRILKEVTSLRAWFRTVLINAAADYFDERNRHSVKTTPPKADLSSVTSIGATIDREGSVTGRYTDTVLASQLRAHIEGPLYAEFSRDLAARRKASWEMSDEEFAAQESIDCDRARALRKRLFEIFALDLHTQGLSDDEIAKKLLSDRNDCRDAYRRLIARLRYQVGGTQ